MSSTNKDWRIRIQHILDAIARIQKYIDGMTEKSFAADEKSLDAVVRNFQIIGEAVRHVPDAVQRAHSEIPWDEMRSMCHVLIHRYDAVDIPTVWTTATGDLPPLVPLLNSLLSDTP